LKKKIQLNQKNNNKMTQITASEVNKLRKQTGAGMMDCKNALVEANGDFELAIDVLRKKGQKVASKRSDRSASEGVVLAGVSEDKKFGVIVSVNCETDFVAKNEDFVAFAKSVLSVALSNKVENKENLESQILDGVTISDKLLEKTGVIGEKIELGFYDYVNSEYVSSYIHHGNRLASLVSLNISNEDYSHVGKDLCMQVAAMSPMGLSDKDISQDILDRELDIAKETARKEGKPEQMIEKIALGRLGKFFKENTLLKQAFIKDGKKSIEQYLKEINPDLNVKEFKRFGLGS
tara:strand:+ start:528 stop:1403 length:876 start_codon:yes stop_codon:yes gene_type:complete